MTRAVLYVRISQDRGGGGLGVARQEEDCRALCARRGWDVAAVHTDNDVSAYSGKRRHGYEQMLEQVKAGDADAIVSWHPDRLHRSPKELEAFIDLVEAHAVQVATVTAGAYDLTTADGRLQARIAGAVARHESEHKADRQRRKHEELARAGRPSGGGRRPFGYEPGGLVVREHEAAVIRDLVRRLIDGEGLSTLTRWLNDESGVTPVYGGHWTAATVRQLVVQGRIAGLRTHRPGNTGSMDRMGGTEVPATWPAIVTTEQLAAVRARFRHGPGWGHTTREVGNLLTPLIVCGLCERPLGTGMVAGKRRYRCRTDRGGCGKVVALMDEVDQEVAARLLAVAAEMEARPGDEVARLRAEVARIDEQLADLDRRYHVEGTVARVDYWAETDRLRALLVEVEARAGTAAAVGDAPGSLAERWPGMVLHQRRAAVARLVRRVLIDPATTRGRAAFNPERVRVDWVA
jgi:DNA invertase Pin-like site-specific DNA recombinase